jgi:DNA-binding NarL/FixJ family response regulator
MPVMDGPATIQVLMRINPAVTIIAASGIASGSSVAKASRAGVKHFLLKPYTAETLLKLFRVAIDGKAIPVSAEPTRPEDAPPTNGISLAPAVPHDHAVR